MLDPWAVGVVGEGRLLDRQGAKHVASHDAQDASRPSQSKLKPGRDAVGLEQRLRFGKVTLSDQDLHLLLGAEGDGPQ